MVPASLAADLVAVVRWQFGRAGKIWTGACAQGDGTRRNPQL
jgi:hypothetical protein